MRSLLLTIIVLTGTTLSLSAQKQKDSIAVQQQVQAFIKSWNQHDFSNMQAYTTDDVDWVNVVGMWWKGRRQVQYAHEAFHKTMFKNVDLVLKSSTIRFLTRHVAIVHIITWYGEFTTPGGNKMGNTDDLATLVYVKQKGKWLLRAGENVTVNEAAKMHDPVKEMDVVK